MGVAVIYEIDSEFIFHIYYNIFVKHYAIISDKNDYKFLFA